MTTTRKDCPRCNGTGLYGDMGVCFGCMGMGTVLVDKFIRAMGSKGDFFGITSAPITYGARKGNVVKCIVRASSLESAMKDREAGATAKPITEEEARKFFKKYGDRVEVKG